MKARIKTNDLYSHLALVSESPSYYYGLKKITYTHVYDYVDENDVSEGFMLYVTLEVPLFRIGGTLPVYRLDVFPVPTHPVERSPQLGYTIVENVPQFLAVDSNEEFFFEMSRELFLSSGSYPHAKVCK